MNFEKNSQRFSYSQRNFFFYLNNKEKLFIYRANLLTKLNYTSNNVPAEVIVTSKTTSVIEIDNESNNTIKER